MRLELMELLMQWLCVVCVVTRNQKLRAKFLCILNYLV